MPPMSQRPFSAGPAKAGPAPARPGGGPPWAVSETRPPAASAPPWAAAEPRPPAAGAPPWAAAEPRPPAASAPPRAVTETRPPAAAAPPWAADDPQRAAAGPPWAASETPVTGPPGRGGPPWPASVPPGSGAFTYSPSDSAPSTGSLPAITGSLIRRQGTFTGRISRDGSSEFPAEPSRYQLYASLGCPWSQRALIACRLLGLDRVIGLTLTEPVADERGWRFADGGDPLTGASFLSDLYRATDPVYPGPCTVPLIWDLRTRRIVSNDVEQITVMLETEFRPFHRPGSPDLYPAARRREIESLATLIFHTVNTGVYKAGLSTTQSGYDQAVEGLFTTLDALEERLARRRFLLGALMTEADVRLYPTLARFDAVYYPMFNCNLRRLSDYRHLWGYTRDLFTHPGFGETTDLSQIKRHYYQSAEWDTSRNKYGIVPIGPQINWAEPHGRARMPG